MPWFGSARRESLPLSASLPAIEIEHCSRDGFPIPTYLTEGTVLKAACELTRGQAHRTEVMLKYAPKESVMGKQIVRETFIMDKIKPLSRQSIVTPLFTVRTEENIGLGLELVTGPTLLEPTFHANTLVRDVCQALTPIMDAVAALHSIGVAHCDLKPTRMHETNRGFVLLGFSHAWSEDLDQIGLSSRSERSHCMGTLGYSPPEIRERLPIDPFKVDVYALGTILGQQLTQKLGSSGPYLLSLLSPNKQEQDQLEFELDPNFVHLLKGMLASQASSRISMEDAAKQMTETCRAHVVPERRNSEQGNSDRHENIHRQQRRR